jgi:hypothetical protein
VCFVPSFECCPCSSIGVLWSCFCLRPLQLNEEGAEDDDEGEEGVPSYRDWVLPNRDFHGMWDCLYYDTHIKKRLLNYAASALVFSEAGVNPQLISWNRWDCLRSGVVR